MSTPTNILHSPMSPQMVILILRGFLQEPSQSQDSSACRSGSFQCFLNREVLSSLECLTVANLRRSCQVRQVGSTLDMTPGSKGGDGRRGKKRELMCIPSAFPAMTVGFIKPEIWTLLTCPYGQPPNTRSKSTLPSSLLHSHINYLCFLQLFFAQTNIRASNWVSWTLKSFLSQTFLLKAFKIPMTTFPSSKHFFDASNVLILK